MTQGISLDDGDNSLNEINLKNLYYFFHIYVSKPSLFLDIMGVEDDVPREERDFE